MKLSIVDTFSILGESTFPTPMIYTSLTPPPRMVRSFTIRCMWNNWIPSGGVNKTSPLVFLPGAGNLFGGSGWLNTPDNRTGWAGYFLDQGYAVYLIDYPNSGRSSGMPNYYPNTAQLASKNLAAPEKFSDNYPQAVNHTQFPGTGMMGDPIFDAWFASQATLPSNLTALELATRKAMCDLLGRIGPAYLIGADFGGTFMILAADECPELVKGDFGIA